MIPEQVVLRVGLAHALMFAEAPGPDLSDGHALLQVCKDLSEQQGKNHY